MPPDFIFMLTRDDRTVPDAIDRLPDVLASGIRHVGFKDIGLSPSELPRLTRAIRAAGATVYLEVVSLDAASEAASAAVAVDLGVDVLMGGTRPDIVVPILAGTSVRYYPFPGEVVGHPSVLVGPIDRIVASAAGLLRRDGVHGLDLLAYRFAGDAPDLMRRVRAVAGAKPLVVAGSLDRRERLEAVVAARAAAFTVGTAAFAGVFPGPPALRDQIAFVAGVVAG